VRDDVRELIARKRDGHALSEEEIRRVVLDFDRGQVSGEVAAAFLMAAFIRGLDENETVAMTGAMIDSGTTLPLSGVSRPKVDKHSTGGVADGVSLVFAPLAASLGLGVAKISGRGLGHTGGTLDKLESIPGFRTDLTPHLLERQVEDVGCAIVAQSADLVPADGKLYALRDATATVASLPLIAASVMCKKLAIATDLILLDVKAGSGGFMKTPEDATKLAESCIALASRWGRGCRAAVTDMSQPLGNAIGNALDVVEAIEVLRGERPGRLLDLTLELAIAAQHALLGTPEREGRSKAESAISSGRALETFRQMVQAQGGDPKVVDDPIAILPSAPVLRPLLAPTAGTLATVDAEAIGRAAVELGAGRRTKGDPVDPAVGIVLRPKIGDLIEAAEEIGLVHARDEAAAARAGERVLAALTLSEGTVEPPPLVYGWHHVR
jgi:pyrimidine-nucleoside phosphorylase